jgi:methionyl-tRNA formyltransferase
MRLVFMGTPGFALPSLLGLVRGPHTVVGVVTRPDRPRGRGQRFALSPVKKTALEMGLPVAQPEDLNGPEFLRQLKAWNADCFAVVAFRILPETVYTMPPKGSVNLHASLLPRYRGAAPIQWAIMNGETSTGVTTFFIERRVDTGDWIIQEKTPINPDETSGDLHDRLAVIGAECLAKTVDLIAKGKAVRTPQTGEPTPAPKILPEHCRIDWKRPAPDLVNLIRGLSPHPGAHTTLNGKRIKLFQAGALPGGPHPAPPGSLVHADREELVVACGRGAVSIRRVQLECGQPMAVEDFLRGHRLPPDTVLGQS